MPSISLTNPTNITELVLITTSTKKLGGAVNVYPFVNLQRLVIKNHNLIELKGYENNPNIVQLDVSNGNNLSAPLPSLTGMSSLQDFKCAGNRITGSFPDITGLSNLGIISVGNNQMSGTLPPDFGALGLTSLYRFNPFLNNFSGALPSFGGVTTLEIISCNGNNFADFTGTFPISLYKLEARDNNFTQTAVDNILQAFVDAGRSGGGIINLGGTGNSPPSSQTNVTLLRSRGWSVIVN